jgi:Asp-tRNA(Asn)/Glu-tRNA(Gln) amidotransferase A subunit family amidase
MNPKNETIHQVWERLKRGEITCTALVNGYLSRIEAQQHLNAFLSVFAHRARARAEGIDAKIKTGAAGKLAGAVVAVKDIIAMKGERLSCGSAFSKMLSRRMMPPSSKNWRRKTPSSSARPTWTSLPWAAPMKTPRSAR